MIEWDTQFDELVKRFLDILGPLGSVSLHHRAYKSQVHLIEADEDEDFTYGALTVALAQLGGREHEWLLMHEFGSHYSLRHTDYAEWPDLTDDE